jgi:hypothetical protein
LALRLSEGLGRTVPWKLAVRPLVASGRMGVLR